MVVLRHPGTSRGLRRVRNPLPSVSYLQPFHQHARGVSIKSSTAQSSFLSVLPFLLRGGKFWVEGLVVPIFSHEQHSF